MIGEIQKVVRKNPKAMQSIEIHRGPQEPKKTFRVEER